MKEWIEPGNITIPEEFQKSLTLHPLVEKILLRRGFNELAKARAFLDPKCFTPSPPSDIPDLPEAVERLEYAIKTGEPVCVWGDFDVDGQTSTSLLVSGIQSLGGNVTYYIPLRQTESHGLNSAGLKRLITEGIKLLITCDTGMGNHKEVSYVTQEGMDVIITDHHDVPSTLPKAHSIVNPKMLSEGHPLRELPGVGCAYKVMEELYRKAKRSDEIYRYLDLVALGIVSDVVVQTGDTRYLLQKGLKVLRNTERIGLRLMMEKAGLNPGRISEEHIGFGLGPRLNALGRLSDANLAVELLTTENPERARILIDMLEGFNERRKVLGEQVLQAAIHQIELNPELLDYEAIVLSHPNWPAGIIGIVASRLVEIYNKPAILITTPPGEPCRGSARSIKGCNISAAISLNQEILLGFGGHPMAAGLSILPELIPAFRCSLSRILKEQRREYKETLELDGYLPLSILSVELSEELQILSPFGPGNTVPLFASRGLSIKGHSRIGKRGEHRLLMVEDEEGNSQRVVWWQGQNYSLPEGRFHLAYLMRSSNYQGQKELQLEWVDWKADEDKINVIQSPAIEIIDYRDEEEPEALLQSLREIPGLQIWMEGEKENSGKNRYELNLSDLLVIWTTPPGPEELKSILNKVSPSKVYLFAVDPPLDGLEAFLKHLAGLAKYALKSNKGRVNILKFSALTGHREITVRKGLDWLSARGHISIPGENEEGLLITEGTSLISSETNKISSELKELLEETKAYRSYFRKADKDSLFVKSQK
ncbi:MAG TPA: single-stranded-DNA-specific exonuclease RecJ [Candidatus Eremiobacteraeota bacterium]|nr:MAG: Single-stranded-DNA-specific exonuclease RecJ [bacterium ADurb.Bin363]HPZ06606.1 single-stranded-DNA-specific exonuclease RecJ [Candidatus Eremiobacteraeota bacterium]